MYKKKRHDGTSENNEKKMSSEGIIASFAIAIFA